MSDSPHLTGEDFEGLLNCQEGGNDAGLASFRAHVAQCDPCGRRWEGYQMQSERLQGLRGSKGARTGEHCPADEQLLRLAAGLLEEPEATSVMDHAVGCDACGTLFKIAVEDLQTEAIPEEAAGALGEPFRIRVAEALQRQRRKETSPISILTNPRVWAGAGIAAGIAVLMLAGSSRILGPSPEQLVARAYEANRIWPIRF